MDVSELQIVDIVGADFSEELTIRNLQKHTDELKRDYPELWAYWATNWLKKSAKSIRDDRDKLPEGKTLAFMVTEEQNALVVFVIPKYNTPEEIWEALGDKKQLLCLSL